MSDPQEVSQVDVPEGLRYSKDHEWLRTESGDGIVGITAYAADELGDVVFVELPAIGRTIQRSEVFGVIESVKTASDLYSPAAGEIVAVNEALAGSPELVNSDPYGDGWMLRIRLEESAGEGADDGLLDAAGYREIIEA